jgi:hypothetical protein
MIKNLKLVALCLVIDMKANNSQFVEIPDKVPSLENGQVE